MATTPAAATAVAEAAAMATTAATVRVIAAVIATATAAAATTMSAATAAANVLREPREVGGGAACEFDVQCGWYDRKLLAPDRRTLPSGNGARCLVGRCVCSNRFEHYYGCARCTTEEKPEFSYSNQDVELTTKIRDELGRHIDLCDLPVGGAPCEVGACERDSHNRTVKCEGDVECDAGGSASGVCIGADGQRGTCACSRGFFCKDCSLHQRDIRDGARCGKYITGGAFCRGHGDCSTRSVCLTSEDGRSFCRCDRGYTCRRCEHHLKKLELALERCPCDAPIMDPFGGEFHVGSAMKLNVNLVAKPWDAEDQCEIRYQIRRFTQAPLRPNWTTEDEAVAFLTKHGTRMNLHEEETGTGCQLKLHGKVGHIYDELGKKLTLADHFYVMAVSVPREGNWLLTPSRLVHSDLFTLHGAAPRRGIQVYFALILTAFAVSGNAQS